MSEARPERLRRYAAATRNVPVKVAREVGARGGLFGVVMATQLLAGATLNSAVRMIRRALDAAGEANVAIGSDMDGALKMLIDCEGCPRWQTRCSPPGYPRRSSPTVIGGNAARFLRSALPA